MLKELIYPFDAGFLLANKRKLKRRLLENSDGFPEKKIAILGGSTTNDIKQMMELFLLNQGIKPQFYEAEYNQYYQEAVFPNPDLAAFAPDIIYIHTTNRNITAYPTLKDGPEAIEKLLLGEQEKFTTIWDKLWEQYHCPIIQNNFEMPFFRLMGNRDVWDIHGAGYFINRLNAAFYAYAQTHEHFHICDINYISADYGLKEWSDPFYYHMYKYALNVNAIPYLTFNVSNIVKSIFGKNKKGLVLDLDNTLWGGVIGDDGVENIALGPEEAEGQGYLAFQNYLAQYEQLGIILAVDSKNDYENAIRGLEHPNSVLKPDSFVSIKANWEPKNRNLKEIADELNLLPESLLFVDDNPAERHIVTEQLPGVIAPELGQVQTYITAIDRGGYFEVTSISADDQKRTEMYRENAARAQQQAKFADYGDYLRSLEMRATIKPFEPVYMARIAQLSNKSNQFNLTTRRYTQAEIETIASDPRYITLYGKLEDRFGDNGVVSVVIGNMDGEVCNIDLWLMSCRVLKRDMEYAMMDELVRHCLANGVKIIRGFYYPTQKNGMVREFFGLQGFTKVSEDSEGNTVWEFEIPESYSLKNHYIEIMKTEDV